MPSVTEVIPDLGQSQVSQQQSSLGKDDFLQLLIAQMQNQDPFSDDMNSLEQISQMSSFSTLEAMQNIEKLLEQQMALSESGFNAQMVGLIGKEVRSLNDLVKVTDTIKPTIAYEAEDSQPVVVALVNSSGRVVASQSMLSERGLNRVDMSDWDVPPGVYRVEVRPQLDSTGSNVLEKLPVFTVGIVRGIDFSGGTSVLDVDGQLVDLRTIVDVRQGLDSAPANNTGGGSGGTGDGNNTGGGDNGGTGDGGDSGGGAGDGLAGGYGVVGRRSDGGVYTGPRGGRAGASRPAAMQAVGKILSVPGKVLGSVLDIVN